MKIMPTASHPLHSDLGLLLLRAMLAVVFLWHGSQKLFGLFGGYGIEGTAGWLGSIGVPLPTLSAVMAGVAEFGGGLALATGFAFRLTLPPLVFTMLVAAFVGHAGKGFDVQNGGMEYPLTLAVAVTALILTGPGRLRLWPARPLTAAVTA